MPLTYVGRADGGGEAMDVFRGIFLVLQVELLAGIIIEICRLL